MAGVASATHARRNGTRTLCILFGGDIPLSYVIGFVMHVLLMGDLDAPSICAAIAMQGLKYGVEVCKTSRNESKGL